MSILRAIRYAAWGAVAVALAAAAFAAWQINTRESGEPLMASAIGGPFTLVDHRGDTVTEADLKGRPSVMFFGFTFCPDVCPTTLFEITTWLDTLGEDADRLNVYFVTVDPERDTPEVLSAYLGAFDPRITALTGTPEQVAAMEKAWRVYSRKVPLDGGGYVMDHTASVYLLNDDGIFTGTIDYKEAEETALAKLRRLIESS